MKNYILLIIASLVLAACSSISKNDDPAREFPHYQVNLVVDPQTRGISVEGSLTLNLEKTTADTLVFYLERGMDITSFTFNGRDVASFDHSPSDIRFMPNAFRILLPTEGDRSLAKIEFSYSGVLNQPVEMLANQITGDYAELGMYLPWFPYAMTQFRDFTFDARVEAPPVYRVFGFGNVQELQGSTIITCDFPIADMVICLSRDVKILSAPAGNNQFTMYYHNFSNKMAENMVENILAILDQLGKWYGEVDMDLTLIESPRKLGGGYARTGGVVLSGVDENIFYSNLPGYERYFAHEFAHLYWKGADVNTWEDWLNEGLAEYSALMYLRMKFGQEEFDRRISNKAANMETVPPVWDFDRQNADYSLVNEVIYNKGPVLLSELEETIGQQAFLDFCRQLIHQQVITTAAFLEVLKQQQGENTASWFEQMLKNR